jgi:hypothetical protein
MSAALGRGTRRPGTRAIWRDYGLSITLAALFAVSLGLQTWAGWWEFAASEQHAGRVPTAFGPDGYVWGWAQATFENWQSEFLQVFIFIVLTTFLIHRRSHESPDADDATTAALRRIEARLDRLDRQASG